MNNKPQCYVLLENEGLTYLIQAYANSSAVGIRGDKSLVEKGCNMIHNFYPNQIVPKIKKVLDNLSCATISEENFRLTVKNFFLANIVLDFEKEEEAVEEAEKLSHSFLADNLKRQTFMFTS